MLVKTYASSVYGIESTIVTVEVKVATGTKYYIVGLPDSAIKESYSALKAPFNRLRSKCRDKKLSSTLHRPISGKKGRRTIWQLLLPFLVLRASYRSINSPTTSFLANSRSTVVFRLSAARFPSPSRLRKRVIKESFCRKPMHVKPPS